MKKAGITYLKFVFPAFLLLLVFSAKAQTTQKAGISTDKLSYRLSNDRDSLYITISTTDSLLQRNILGSGITFTLNAGGGPKSVTFPVNEKKDGNSYIDAGSRQLQMKVLLTPYRKIKVSGFIDIHDELLSCRNLYGIRAAMVYDAGKNNLGYRLTLPLKILQTDAAGNKEWPYSIKVNRLEREVTAYLYIEAHMGLKSNNNYSTLTAAANSNEAKAFNEQNAERELDQLKAGKVKFNTRTMDNSSPFSKRVILLTRGAEFSGKYVLQ